MLSHNNLWHSASSILRLNGQEVHLWRANLNLPEWRIEKLSQTLCAVEMSRADRFVFDKHRRRFIAGRGFLRTILSRYLDIEPSQLDFSYSAMGKPALASNNIKRKICFNLSHSNEIALYAITSNRSVGVDIEYIHTERNVKELARSFFYPKEFSFISSLSQSEQKEAFLKIWTVKEAYVKATGDGLSRIEQVEVSLSVDGPAGLLKIHGDPNAVTRWSTCQTQPFPGYVAAIVV